MDVADAPPLGALRPKGGGDRAVGRAPADEQQLAVGIAVRDGVGNVLDHGLDLGGAQADHLLVVQGLVVDVAAAVLLLEAADAVLEAGRARDRPGAGQRLRDRGGRA